MKFLEMFNVDYSDVLKDLQNEDLFFKEQNLEYLDYLLQVNKNNIWIAMKDVVLYFYGEKEFDTHYVMKNFNKNEIMHINSYGISLANNMLNNSIKIKNNLEIDYRNESTMWNLFSNEKYELILSQSNKSIYWYFISSKCYVKLGDFDNAIIAMEEYLKLLELESNLFMPCTDFYHVLSMHFWLGKLYLEKNEKEKARHYLEKCVSFHNEWAEPDHRHFEGEKLLSHIVSNSLIPS